MFSKVNNASIAVVASDDDVHLFFDCVFEEEYNLRMFLDVQLEIVLQSQDCFDCVIMDSRSAWRAKAEGRWEDCLQIFKGRLFVLREVDCAF
ncbi:MAG: hypothetical protein IJL24_07710, partial [Treponema sp.]|nr:hypothetical protein [Treponema sp.]